MSRSKRVRSRTYRGEGDLMPSSPSPYANKSTDDVQRRLIRAYIARGLYRGWTHQKIADGIAAELKIKMIRQNVSYLARSIMEEATAHLDTDPRKLLVMQLGRCDQAVEALWDAWEKSSGDREVNTSRSRRTAVDAEGKAVGRASDIDDVAVRTERHDPDPRYMTAIARWEELRSKLMGLLREPKDESDTPPLPPSSINVTVKMESGATLNLGAPAEPDTALPPPNGQVIDVTPTFAPALSAGPSKPGEYRP